MSDQQMRDELMTLIFAGHETTAHTLTWAWYLSGDQPGQAREGAARDRRDSRRQADRRSTTCVTCRTSRCASKSRFAVFQRCGSTAARRRRICVSAATFSRRAAILAVSPLATGRNAKYFDKPLEYRPERWTREFERQLPKGAYVPFAAGPRVCLGKQFAMMEMRIVLGTLIQNVDVNLLEGFEPDIVPQISLNPGERGMQMKVRFRDGAPVLAGDHSRTQGGFEPARGLSL